MFFYGRIIIPLHSLSSKSRNSKVFTHSDFKMALSFAIIGSIAATALKFINNARTSDKIPVFLRSGIVYKFKCGGCNATYYGKTKFCRFWLILRNLTFAKKYFCKSFGNIN